MNHGLPSTAPMAPSAPATPNVNIKPQHTTCSRTKPVTSGSALLRRLESVDMIAALPMLINGRIGNRPQPDRNRPKSTLDPLLEGKVKLETPPT